MKSGIIYHGPSLYDGAPIVVIATFTKSNSKTGGRRADLYPAR
jgi:hypothetical protein